MTCRFVDKARLSPQVGVDGVLDDKRAVFLVERTYFNWQQPDCLLCHKAVNVEAPPANRPRQQKQQDRRKSDRYTHRCILVALDDLTHTLFAVTLSQTPLRRAGPGTTAAILLASIAPDIDIVSALQGGSVAYLAAHRGPTHSAIGILCLGLATAAFVRLCSTHVRFWNMAGVATLAVLFHILMDLPTSYGTRLLSPVDWTWYALDWFPIVDIHLLAILLIGALALLFRPAARTRIAAVVLVLVAGHYALRAFAHDLALRRTIPDISSLSRSCLATGLVSWNSLRDENDETSLCAERRAALPTFGSPFTWRLVRQFSGWYELSDFDLLTGRAGPTMRFPNERTREILDPSLVRTVAVFLHFARFPAARVSVTAGGTTIRWDDMRFVGGFTRVDSERPGPRRAFTAVVELDRAGRVVAERLGGS